MPMTFIVATIVALAHVPAFMGLGNMITTTLLRAGVRLTAFGHPMYLLTVRGRKSGKPRTTPVVIIELDGRRYLLAPYGIVAWVRNLRAAGRATLTRGRRAEEVQAVELVNPEAAHVLKSCLAVKMPSFTSAALGVTTNSPVEEIERATLSHPVFLVQGAT
jgi:deazaflavin-dependent oxidoreductase (nitroreductase family)